MPRIFVSYAATDGEFALQLITDLRDAGAEIITDSNNFQDRAIGTIGVIEQPFEQKLAGCQQLVVVQTPEALASPRVLAIVDAALQQVQTGQMMGVARVLAPTLNTMEAQEIPAAWSTASEFDASQDYPRALARLCLSLGLSSHADMHVAPPPPASYIPLASSPQTQRVNAIDRPIRPPRYFFVPSYWRFILFAVAIVLVLAVAITAFFIHQSPRSANLATTTTRTITPQHTATPTPTPIPTPTPTPTPIPAPAQPVPVATTPPKVNNPPVNTTSAITNLGSLNFQAYCLSIGDTGASLDQNNAYGWTCVTPAGDHTLIDTNAACQAQHSNQPNVLARMVNFSDANNWRCYSHVTTLGSINFTQYCQSLGDGASLDGSTAYDWHCVVPSGNHVIIDTNAACQWQYNESDAIASISNYSDPNGWVCFGKA